MSLSIYVYIDQYMYIDQSTNWCCNTFCFLRKERAKRKICDISSPPLSPEDQMHMIQIHEESVRKKQTEPSNKDQDVSKHFTMNIHLLSTVPFWPLTLITEVHALHPLWYPYLWPALPATWTSVENPAPLTPWHWKWQTASDNEAKFGGEGHEILLLQLQEEYRY